MPRKGATSSSSSSSSAPHHSQHGPANLKSAATATSTTTTASTTTTTGLVHLGKNRVETSLRDYADEDVAFDLARFQQEFQFVVVPKEQFYRQRSSGFECDLVGIDASLANALRRILIAEIPTMAIEKVFIRNNTSILADEVLAQRLGLVPIKADPRKFDFKSRDEEPSERNTIVFTLKTKCTRNPDAPPNSVDPNVLYLNSIVKSGQLQWEPKESQEETFADDPIRPVHDDITIAALRPGQELDLELHCEKNIGRVHAKWSPVATASYRLHPRITLKEPIVGKLAEELKACFADGVIEIDEDARGVRRARVANERNDTVSREVLRHENLADKVELGRVKDHFIFSIESDGNMAPEELLIESIKILMEKIQTVKQSLKGLVSTGGGGGGNDTEEDDAAADDFAD